MLSLLEAKQSQGMKEYAQAFKAIRLYEETEIWLFLRI